MAPPHQEKQAGRQRREKGMAQRTQAAPSSFPPVLLGSSRPLASRKQQPKKKQKKKRKKQRQHVSRPREALCAATSLLDGASAKAAAAGYGNLRNGETSRRDQEGKGGPGRG